MIYRAARAIAFLAFSSLIAVSAASEAPKAVFPEARFEFGEVMSGAVVERDFAVKNEGTAPLVIEKVAMTKPLLATQKPHESGAGRGRQDSL